jgi:hypothetical protein
VLQRLGYAATTVETRCYNRRRRRWLLQPAAAAATVGDGGYYNLRRRVLPAATAGATICGGGCYHRRRRLLQPAAAGATVGDDGCYNLRRRLLQPAAPATTAAATLGGGCYSRRRRLLPSAAAAATLSGGGPVMLQMAGSRAATRHRRSCNSPPAELQPNPPPAELPRATADAASGRRSSGVIFSGDGQGLRIGGATEVVLHYCKEAMASLHCRYCERAAELRRQLSPTTGRALRGATGVVLPGRWQERGRHDGIVPAFFFGGWRIFLFVCLVGAGGLDGHVSYAECGGSGLPIPGGRSARPMTKWFRLACIRTIYMQFLKNKTG